ncbi:unnamed protein product [Amoebophrya sp. A120]|nr:unnamed protein product [Amoebophrya sp. A120]|eukprot:GSA120T00009277001.1
MFYRSLLFAAAAATGAEAVMSAEQMDRLNLSEEDAYITLFNEKQSPEVEAAFKQAYDHLAKDFDTAAYKQHVDQLHQAVSFLKASPGYKSSVAGAHCDFGIPPPAAALKGVSPFPGGVVSRLFGFDIAKLTSDLASKASGAAGAAGGMPIMLAVSGLASGAGLIQGAMNIVLQIVPPLIPPPIWINQPLPCLPMITGHNCFGAVLYPITAADFVIADVTDAQLDGVIAGFPGLFKDRIGKAPDQLYKACYASYMSQQCASIFPRCNSPMSRYEPTPVGRLPMCFTHCILTLVSCPGFWITDIMDECMTVSAPPMCTMAVFWNLASLPPQYSSFEDSQPPPEECPSAPASLAAVENAKSDFDLYSTGKDEILPSPFSGTGVSKVPNA